MHIRRIRRSTLKTSAAAIALLAFSAPGVSFAQAARYSFDIPAQDVSSALIAYGRAARQQLVFDGTTLRDKHSAALVGEYSAQEGLYKLLEGTGLRAEFVPSGAVRIVSASDPQSGSAAGGGADGTVQALVVTAQKREENIQDVPIAMSAFTQEDLTRSQVAGGPDLMTQVPNFTFTKTNFTGYSIQIRGIGTQAISATTDPAVAVAFNNTPFIRNRFFEQEFYDLERVEVLRGPQGTLYGRNATAGVVNILSAKPKNRFEAKVSGDVSNYNSTRLEGMLNLPLVEDKAALRLAGAWTKRDGFVKNILTGEQTDGRDLWSARVTLRVTPTDRISANLIYERFTENDDRLRSGKQLCQKDLGPAEINGYPVGQTADPIFSGPATASFFSQGCKPSSLYSPDSFETPNGYALPYYGAAAGIGAPVYGDLDPYRHSTQSRDLREIETHITPDYEASNDTVELQLQFELPGNLTLNSETGFNRDHIFSFEDYNRFDTTPGVFMPGRNENRFDIIDENGVICDPQLGCTNRLAAGDLATARSRQFSQEFRLSSDFDGPVNFNIGANFLRYDTEDKYYVFINSLTAFLAGAAGTFDPNDKWISDNSYCYSHANSQLFDLWGYVWSNPSKARDIGGCLYIDPNDIHSLNDQGRNYFLSKNPYHLLSYAAFGEAYWQIVPDLKLTVGLRWTNDRKTAPQIPSWLLAGNLTYGTATRKVINQEWREPTGRLALDWKPQLSFTDETLLYGSYVRGYKAGGANPPPAIPVFPPVGGIDAGSFVGEAILTDSLTHPETFKPEFVNAYEIGTKNTLLDGRLTFNINGFFYDYKGYQISEIVDRSAVNFNFDANVWGSELEVDWRPLENLRLGFKGGYEHTRLADGSRAVDLMDRTAGMPGWVVKRPFPTFPSNCIVPEQFALVMGCEGYKLGDDPVTGLPFDPVTLLPYVEDPQFIRAANGDVVPLNLPLYPDYPGFDVRTVPNHGEGFAKDLSGNQLPNAPKFTATITADYTLPLPSDWLMTLHTDLYYQSEAWTRVFNDPGYDKIKAYSNINVAAIFSNEAAGWQVMAYVKNLLDKDNITGAFLNSDDTGLTTNVFLNEPRLFGLRVTKEWSESAWWSAHANHSGWYPFRLEVAGDYGRFAGGHEILAPHTTTTFPADHPYPLGVQNDLDWGSGGGVKFTYQPGPGSWSASAAVRYGRARGAAEAHPKWSFPGGYLTHKYHVHDRYGNFYKDPDRIGWYNYATTTSTNEEVHTIADFAIGKDVGLGSWASASNFSFGLRYAKLKSSSDATLHGRPDFYLPPDDIAKYGGQFHRVHAQINARRDFEGAGPAINWEATIPFRGDGDHGLVGVDVGLGGSVLWGKQHAQVRGYVNEDYVTGVLLFKYPRLQETRQTTSLDASRSKTATVPGLNANLGLTYSVGGFKVSGGYRVERYFDAIDGGIAKRKTYDRQYDGPYFKVSVGFGG